MRCEVSWSVVAVVRVARLYSVGKRLSGRKAAHDEVAMSVGPWAGSDVGASVMETTATKTQRASRESGRQLKGS